MVTTKEELLAESKVMKLQADTVIFSLSLGRFGTKRRISSDGFEIDADKEYIGAYKILLACDELKAINSLYASIRHFVDGLALQSPLKRGMWLLPVKAVEDMEAAMTAFSITTNVLVEKLLNVYDDKVTAQKQNLRSTFNALDYPSREALRDYYYVTWRYLKLEMPNQLPPALQAAEKEKMDQMWQDAVEGIQIILRQNLLGLVKHLKEALAPNPDGTKKRFYDSSIDKVRDFLEVFSIRNVTDDKDLERIVQQVRSILGNVDADGLKENEPLRDKIRTEFAEITKTLDGMIGDAPKRRLISLDDD